MANFNDAFQPESGINLDDLVGIFSGTNDPSVVGEVAPIGSLLIRSTGHLYQKIGAADTAWMVFSQGSGEAVKVSATDTTADYLNAKLIVAASLTKTVQNVGNAEALLLDLASIGTAGTYFQVTTNSKGQVISGSNPTTLGGYGITNGQPLDSTLTALAGYTTIGFPAMTAADVFAGRTMTGTANQIIVTDGAGTAGNPTFSLPATNFTIPGTQGVIVPMGTTAERVTTTATVRFNSTLTALEYYNGADWVSLVASTGGTVTSVAAAAPAQGLTITGSPITTTGTLTFTLANDLAALEGLTTFGGAYRTAADAWTTHTLAGTTDRIMVTNGDGVLGAPTFDIASTYAGQATITTLGTISTGTWLGTVIDTSHGGTGRSTIGGANQLLGVNTTAAGLEYKTLANTTGISLAFTGGQITIGNTGVTSIAGTTNQVNATASTGAVTLSLPQSIATTSTPVFASVTVAADPTLPLQVATKQYVDNAVQGVSPKQAVRVATTANITLSGNQTLDDVLTVDGDRVLVKNQTVPAQNGIYIAGAGAWTRAADFDTWSEVPSAFVFVQEGTTLADTAWVSTSNVGGTLGTTSIPWVQFSSASDITAGTGLTRSGNVVSITPIGTAGTYNSVTTNAEGQVTAGTLEPYLTANQAITLQGSVIGSGSSLINTTLSTTGVTAGTYQSVTVNAEGRITAASNPNTLSGYFITDAQPLNAYLTSLSSAGNGIVVRSGTTALARTIIANSTKISITNGDGVAGNPTIDVVESNLVLDNISGNLAIAKGGTGLSAVGAANQILGVNAGGGTNEYKTLTGSGITITHSPNEILFTANTNGTVTSVSATGSTGLTVGGSPITASGTLTFTLGTELQGLSGLATLGLVARTGAGTYASRSVVSGNGTITITNPVGTIGNIGVDLSTAGTSGTYRSVTTDVYGRVISGTNPTTLSGYGITDAAPIAASYITLGNDGALTNERVLTGTASQITITDTGANGTATISISADPSLPGTGKVHLPTGSTAQRPVAPIAGDSRFNTDSAALEYYDGTQWQPVGRQAFVDTIFPMGFVDRLGESTLSWVEATRTVTITPIATKFSYYHTGVRVDKTTAESVVFPNTSGMWYISYSAAGVLTASSSFYDLKTQVPVANLYWDATNSKILTFADERHGATMDWQTHQYLHVTQGVKFGGGLAIGNYTTAGTGSANTDAEFSLANGSLWDEDLKISITHATTPTNANEQVLSTIALLPVLYRVGAGTANWASTTANSYAVKQGTARIQYNLNTAGTWSVVDAPEGAFVAVWVFATNGYFEPVIAFVGQRYDTTLQNALDNNTFETLDFGMMPTAEGKILYRLIFQTSSAYANAPKALLAHVKDMRTTSELVVSTAGTVSHDSLSGLANDDHLQYVHTTTARTISAQHTFSPITANAPFILSANAQAQLVTGLNADLLDGLHAASFQLIDSDLTALANTTTAGLYAVTGTGTSATRTLTAPAEGFTITNGNGVAGNPTFVLANDLAGLEGLSTAGIAVRTGTSTWATRTLVAGTGITLTNADGVAGNITIAASTAGSVTSVGLALPSIFTVTGTPVTGTGTLTGALATQAANTFFVGPLSGAAAAPTFRTVGLDELSDVVLTTPSSGNILSFNGTNWVNTAASAGSAAGLVGSGQAGVAAWTPLSGTRYTADFVHNLGTNNLVITVYDSTTNAIVIPDLVSLVNTNTIRVQAVGNGRTLRVVAVANGLNVGGSGGSGSLIVQKDGSTVAATTTTANFTGPVVVSDAGAGITNLNFISRFSYFANSLDSPNNADFAINALAPVTTDPTYASLNVRSFSNTVEQGVGMTCSVPSGATQATFKIRGRATTAPGATAVVQPRLYYRLLPNGTAVGAWSAAYELANIAIPTNAFFQYSQQTVPLATLGLTAGGLYQLELTRRVAGVTGTNLAAAFLLAEITIEFY